MPTYSDILFGKIALTNRLVGMAQLNDCVATQERGHGLTLAEIMIQKGLLTPHQARRVQKAQALTQFMRAEKIFARIALDRGLAPVNVLRSAFQEQERSNYRTRLAQLLTEKRLLSTDQVDVIVEEQLHRLAEETARIEEAGFQYESLAADERARKVEEMADWGVATDLDGKSFRQAVGPRGLIDDQAINRTMPVMAVPNLDEIDPAESAGARQRRRERAVSPLAQQEPNEALDPTNLTGAVIASRYQVGEKVGEGGMGTVYRAQHCLMDKTVALKVLHPSLVSSKSSLDRFRREIRAASRFQHKNVIQLYDAGEGEGGIFYMAMEFAEGETLEDLLRRKKLPLDRAVDIMRQVLSAIAEAHKKGIVHRDLKAGNIMMVKGNAREDIAKVTDFGLAKIAMESTESDSGQAGLFKTQEGVVTGTPQYMSPEQASGELVDTRSDLYSLGVILFELITGQLPFKSNTPMGFLGKHIVEPPPIPSTVATDRGISTALDEITLKLLEKKPADRYQTAEEVLGELDRRCDMTTLASTARDQRPGRKRKRETKRRPGQKLPRRTMVMPSDRDDPVAMTMEVEPPPPLGLESAPSRDAQPLEELGMTVEALPPGLTQEAPPPVGSKPKRGKGLALVAISLVLLLGGVVGVAIYLATQLDPDTRVSSAERMMSEDPTGARVLLEAYLEESPGNERAQDLLERAREKERRRDFDQLVAEADRLSELWKMGTGARSGAEKAAGFYREALELVADAAVQQKLDDLSSALNPSASPTPSTSPVEPSQDPLAEQRAIMASLLEALESGRFDDAEALLGEAARAMGSGHPKLEQFRTRLRVERLLAAARKARDAERFEEARELYEQAKEDAVDAELRTVIANELAPIQKRLQSAEGQRAVRDALEAALKAALALDVPKAEGMLAGVARQAARLKGELKQRYDQRRKALGELSARAERLSAIRQAVTTLEQQDAAAVEPATVGAESEALQALRAWAREGLAADEPLLQGFLRVVGLEEERARALAEAVTAARPDPVDKYLQRFNRLVARLRKLPEIRETKALVLERLDDFRSAKSHPGFGRGDDESRAWINAGAERFEGRWAVWNALGGDDDDWVFVPGGEWTSPGGEVYALPANGYFVASNELTCALWDRYLQAMRRPRPRYFRGPTEQPVTWISKDEAERYCAWRTKQVEQVTFRLPTAGEWERAARAEAGTEFPWGDAFEGWRQRGQDHAAIAGMDLQRVRSLRNDRNTWGLWDMVGNAQELTSDVRDGRLVIKGGSINHSADQAGASAVSLEASGREAQPYIGIRLVAVER